jgi:hypothetical protein
MVMDRRREGELLTDAVINTLAEGTTMQGVKLLSLVSAGTRAVQR